MTRKLWSGSCRVTYAPILSVATIHVTRILFNLRSSLITRRVLQTLIVQKWKLWSVNLKFVQKIFYRQMLVAFRFCLWTN